mmetsp:Transcript_20836/g.29261  ORF Transcript_20836/g.29261 Transcript_20836/m.29261 type:complete len:168 (-) Transcript_20836:104-607(-)
MEKEWRCYKYGPLVWLELLLKLMCIGVALASLAIYDASDRTLSSTRVGQCVLMGILGGVLLAGIVLRVLDKELLALGFAIAQFIAHWIMTLITIVSIDPSSYLFTFVFLMTLSEYIRLMFLFLADNIDVKYVNKYILAGVSGLFIVCYLIVIALQVVIWLTEFSDEQ